MILAIIADHYLIFAMLFMQLKGLLQHKDQRVIDARHIFARKRYFDKNRWEPTEEIIASIAEAIFGKL